MLLSRLTVMTTVRLSDSWGFWFGGGGWGTSPSSPFGVSGVITMKMMISTSSTSIIGVILMSAFGPPEDPPTAIPINCSLTTLLSARRRRVALAIFLDLVRQQTKLIHAVR